jgi:predicted Zn-dependent peptidase
MNLIAPSKDPGLFEKAVLSNGIALYHRNTDTLFGLPKIAVSAVVTVGGRDDTTGKEGAAHFFEHMPFRGTKKFPTLMDITYEIEQNGGYINAFTTDEATGYEIVVPKPMLEMGLDRLADILLHPILRPEDIVMEREIIIEELRNKLANVQFFARQELYKGLLGAHPLVHAVIGTEEALKSIAREELIQFHDTYYNASNITLFTVGSFGLEEIVPTIERYFGNVRAGKQTERTASINFPSLLENQLIFSPPQYNRSIYMLGRRLPKSTLKESLMLKFFRDMLSSGMNSPLNQEIREKRGLAYNLGLFHNTYSDLGLLIFFVSTRFQHMDEVETIFWREAEAILHSDHRFSEVKHMVKQSVLYRDYSLGTILDEAIDDVLDLGNVMSLNDYIAVVDSITLEETRNYVKDYLKRDEFLAIKVNCEPVDSPNTI